MKRSKKALTITAAAAAAALGLGACHRHVETVYGPPPSSLLINDPYEEVEDVYGPPMESFSEELSETESETLESSQVIQEYDVPEDVYGPPMECVYGPPESFEDTPVD